MIRKLNTINSELAPWVTFKMVHKQGVFVIATSAEWMMNWTREHKIHSYAVLMRTKAERADR